MSIRDDQGLREIGIDAANDMFLVWISFFVLIGIVFALVLTGHSTAAILVSPLGTLAIMWLALVGLRFFPAKTRQIVSSDWLVDRIVARHYRKYQQLHPDWAGGTGGPSGEADA
jgi:hypothetical protein